MKKSWVTMSVWAAALTISQAVNAVSYTYTFERITTSQAPDIGSQLTVQVSRLAPFTVNGTQYAEGVSFQFFNSAFVASTIAEIYFDDGFLNHPPTVETSDWNEVKYYAGENYTKPANLPGGNAVGFEATSIFSADIDGNGRPLGVSAADQWVRLSYGIDPENAAGNNQFANFQEVIDALADGSLRIGLHIRGLPTGQSDSYVNLRPPPTAVPDGGATVALLGLGILGLTWFNRRRG